MTRCAPVLGLLALVLPAFALAEPPLPSKMTQLDAARLDAAFMHEQAIMQRAQAEAEPYEREIARICKAYGIDRAQLGKAVGVNTETGEIQRAQAPQPHK
jgi:hypothetical protein